MQVVLVGLDALLPLMQPELLVAARGGGGGGGNKLARRLFTLLAYMMEVHPGQVRGPRSYL